MSYGPVRQWSPYSRALTALQRLSEILTTNTNREDAHDQYTSLFHSPTTRLRMSAVDCQLLGPHSLHLAGEDGELQQEVNRLRSENAALAQQVKSYQADVANLVSLRGVGHTGSKQRAHQQP